MALPDRVKLVVLFGGQSAEHEVSCSTAAHVLRAIDHQRYDALPIGITRRGEWLRDDAALATLERGALELPDRLTVAGTAIEPLPAVQASDDVPTVVLPLLHGPHGEDGTVQGLLELAGVPFVGSGVLGSALSMDKAAVKELLATHRVPQCRWRSLRTDDITDAVLDDVVADLGLPVFVKPANMGSSVGVSKVADRAGLAGAVEAAVEFDDWVVIEEAVVGRELEVGVLGNHHAVASVVGEVRPGGEFYDYDDKYVDGTAQLLIPAPVPAPVSDELRALAVQIFRLARCEGLARVDFFWEEDGRGLLLNEINTIPGFTPISMYPKLWEASGLPYAKLLDELIALALERHQRRSRFKTER